MITRSRFIKGLFGLAFTASVAIRGAAQEKSPPVMTEIPTMIFIPELPFDQAGSTDQLSDALIGRVDSGERAGFEVEPEAAHDHGVLDFGHRITVPAGDADRYRYVIVSSTGSGGRNVEYNMDSKELYLPDGRVLPVVPGLERRVCTDFTTLNDGWVAELVDTGDLYR